ncbi:hypothetical protein O9993_05630 [Vibrio lentus]|nr:hypothetical protein [Vibrio lentus]
MFSSVVSVASFATGASLPSRRGDGLPARSACVVVGRGVCRGHVSILTCDHQSRCCGDGTCSCRHR